MAQNPGKMAFGLLVLVLVWIGVYWWWTPQRGPRISYASDGAVISEANVPGGGVTREPPFDAPLVTEPPTEPAATTSQPEANSSASRQTSTPRERAVIPPVFIDYTIQKGDTLAEISKRFFGTTAHASTIARANPFMDAGKLKTGRTIRIPKDPSNVQGKPNPKFEAPQPATVDRNSSPPKIEQKQPDKPSKSQPAASTEYVVKSGDSLSKIAKTLYGDASMTDKIFQANRDALSSPDSLKEGQKLRIPPR